MCRQQYMEEEGGLQDRKMEIEIIVHHWEGIGF